MKVLVFLILISGIASAQKAKDGTIHLSSEDESAYAILQRDLANDQVVAYQIADQLRNANDRIKEASSALSAKDAELKKKYHAEDMQFNANQLYFFKLPPTAPAISPADKK